MSKSPRMLLIVALLASTGAAALATPTPAPPASQPGIAFERRDVPGGGQPFALVAADVNGDQALDLLVTNPATDTVDVLLGRGDGSFDAHPRLATGRFPRGIAVADFDGDGHLDVAVAAKRDNRVAVHRGGGDGSFAPARKFVAGSQPFLLTAADLNGDRAPDLAVALEGAGAVAVLLNDGAGGFAPATVLTVGRSPADVAVADVNGDGAADLAVASWGANEIAVLLGDGRGGFAAPITLPASGRGLYQVLLTDLDGDAQVDVAWTDLHAQAIAIRHGDGHGAFARPANVPMGSGLRSAVAVDLNGDGRVDLAGSNQSDGTVTVALAQADGGYLVPQVVPVGEHPRMVVAGDFDRDGRVDLATTNMKADTLTVLLNRGPTTIDLVATPTPVPTPPAFDATTFNKPNNIALDGRGGLYVSDQMHHRVARVDLASGAVTTVAGTGGMGGGGDGGPATAAQLTLPGGVALDAAGNLYIGDHGNNRVRRVDPNGIITTVAGTGVAGFSGDGGPATAAQLNGPFAVLIDAEGRLVISDFGNARIRRVDADGIITTVLGTGIPSFSGDGGPGTAAAIKAVTGLALHPSGDLLICDQYNFRVRRLGRDGIVTSIAGNGDHHSEGDGGPATAAGLSFPASVSADPAGNVYVSDQDGNRVRRIGADGMIDTVAGTGVTGYDGDGGPGNAARVWFPFGLASAADGTLYIADRYNHAIRAVDPQGTIRTVAGGPREESWADIAPRAPTVGPQSAAPLGPTPALVWEQAFFSGSDANAAYAAAAAPDGALYVAGDIGSGADWIVMRLAPDGREQWRFVIDTAGVEVPHALVLSPNGQIVAAGETHGTGKDVLVVGLSPDGREQWRYTAPRAGHQIAHGIAADRAGNLYVASESERHWEVFSLTPAGALRWTRRGADGAARAVAVAPDDTVIVAGHDHVFWRVEAMDRDGAPRWQHTVPPVTQGADGAIAAALAVAPSGEVTVTGMWTGPSGRALRVERLEAGGRSRWAYVAPVPPDGFGRAVVVDAAGNAIVAGETGTDWVLLSLDPEGQPRWRLTHDGGGGAINKDQALALALVGDDGLLAAGVVHPVPPKLPNLGWIQWRIARYALPR